MVSSDAWAGCEFVRSKPLSDCPYSRLSDCGYAADNPRAVLFATVLSTRSHATAVPAPPLASLCAGADRPAHEQSANPGLTSGLPRVVKGLSGLCLRGVINTDNVFGTHNNHAPDIAAMDLFVVPTIGFDLLYALIIVLLDRRGLVWINITTNPTAEWIARQLTEAFPWDEAPDYLIRDRDQIYRAIVTRRLRAMGIRDKPTAPASPSQNGFAERLIGSIRRECVDHFIALGEAHLRRIFRSYARYYNSVRTRRSLHKDAPMFRPIQQIGITRSPVLGGLHHHYVRV